MIGYSKPSMGFTGSGIRGLIQGAQEGSAEYREQEKFDMLKLKFDKQQDNQEKTDFNSKMYNIEQVQNNGGNIAPLLSGMNKYMGESKNFANDKFRQAPISEFQDEQGALTPEFLNRYRSETGADYDKEELPASFTMHNDEEGERFFDFDTFANGSSNYQTYRQEQDMVKMAEKAKLMKSMGEGAGADYGTLKVLNDQGLLEGKELENFKALEKKKQLISTNAMDNLAGRPFEEDIAKVKAGAPLGDRYKEALKMEFRTGKPFKNDKIDASIAAARDMNTGYTDMEKLMKSGTDLGAGKAYEQQAASYAKDYDSLNDEQRKRALNSLLMKSKAGRILSGYVKSLSGASVSEEEFNRLMLDAIGGDINKINAETLMTVLGDLNAKNIQSVEELVDDIEPLYPASKMNRQDRLNKLKRYEGEQAKIVDKPEDTRKPREAVIDDEALRAVSRQGVEETVGGMADFGTDAISSGVKAIGEAFKNAFKKGKGGSSTPKAHKDLGPIEHSGRTPGGTSYTLPKDLTPYELSRLTKAEKKRLNTNEMYDNLSDGLKSVGLENIKTFNELITIENDKIPKLSKEDQDYFKSNREQLLSMAKSLMLYKTPLVNRKMKGGIGIK